MLLHPNYEESYPEDCKERLTSVKNNYIMKANMLKGSRSVRKLMPDIKSIASKKGSEKFLVPEVRFTMRNLESKPKTDFK